MKFESDLFPDSSKLDSDSLPISMQFGLHWQKIRATLIRLKVLHSLLLLLLKSFWMIWSFWLLLLWNWMQLPNLEMQPTFVRVGIVSDDEGLDAWKRKF
jgi:hypothetical protein